MIKPRYSWVLVVILYSVGSSGGVATGLLDEKILAID